MRLPPWPWPQACRRSRSMPGRCSSAMRNGAVLGVKPPCLPAGSRLAEGEAVVQAEIDPLPELEVIRRQLPAGPEYRPGHRLAGESRLHFFEPQLERLARGQRAGLLRGPGADLAHARAGGEICIGLLVAHLRYGALDAHLPGQALPVEQQRDIVVARHLPRLARAKIAVERETGLVPGLH